MPMRLQPGAQVPIPVSVIPAALVSSRCLLVDPLLLVSLLTDDVWYRHLPRVLVEGKILSENYGEKYQLVTFGMGKPYLTRSDSIRWPPRPDPIAPIRSKLERCIPFHTLAGLKQNRYHWRSQRELSSGTCFVPNGLILTQLFGSYRIGSRWIGTDWVFDRIGKLRLFLLSF